MHLTEHKPNHSQIPLLCMLDRQKHVTRCHGRGRRHMPADDAVTLLSTGLLRMFFALNALMSAFTHYGQPQSAARASPTSFTMAAHM